MQVTNMQANELINKQQRPGQSQSGTLGAFKINFVLMMFCCLEAMLTDRHRGKSTSKKKKFK